MGRAFQNLVRDLDLAPHPEGGYYRELHRSSGRLELERGPRSAVTVIDYALEAGSFSAFHRVASEEVWSWCDGDPLVLQLLAEPRSGDAQPAQAAIVLGPDRTAGQRRLEVVSAGVWQAAEPLSGAPNGYSWCSCIVAPGFDFADFELARRADLEARFPEHAELVRRLTR